MSEFSQYEIYKEKIENSPLIVNKEQALLLFEIVFGILLKHKYSDRIIQKVVNKMADNCFLEVWSSGFTWTEEEHGYDFNYWLCLRYYRYLLQNQRLYNELFSMGQLQSKMLTVINYSNGPHTIKVDRASYTRRKNIYRAICRRKIAEGDIY